MKEYAADDFEAIRKARQEIFRNNSLSQQNRDMNLKSDYLKDGGPWENSNGKNVGWHDDDGNKVAEYFNCKRQWGRLCYFDGDYECIKAHQCMGEDT